MRGAVPRGVRRGWAWYLATHGVLEHHLGHIQLVGVDGGREPSDERDAADHRVRRTEQPVDQRERARTASLDDEGCTSVRANARVSTSLQQGTHRGRVGSVGSRAPLPSDPTVVAKALVSSPAPAK
jgi:hypothetical protein